MNKNLNEIILKENEATAHGNSFVFDMIQFADRNWTNYEGNDLLLEATKRGLFPLFKCLLGHNYNPNRVNHRGQTIFHIICGELVSPEEYIEYLLLINDLQINFKSLHFNFNLNIQDQNGKTALLLACERKLWRIAFELSNLSPDINICDNRGIYPLDLVPEERSWAFADWFKKNKERNQEIIKTLFRARYPFHLDQYLLQGIFRLLNYQEFGIG